MENPNDVLQKVSIDAYRALLTSFPNGVLVLFDAQLRYRVIGPDPLPFSGCRPADMIGKPVEDLFPKETVDTLKPELRATIDGEPRSFDVEYDGSIHHLETRPTSVEGEPYGVLVTQDVSETRQVAAQLERQNERLDQFASMVSHDIRSPLSIALGHLEQYRDTGDETDLEAIEDALLRMNDLLTDLAALARHGTPTGECRRVSLAEVARRAWSMVDSRSATLSTEECTVDGDETQLQALFENLFRNAVGHGGPDVTVRVGPLADGFYVEDTGRGIPPENRDRVLEHGFTTGYSGTGVGLTIVRRVGNAHGLDVTVSESAEGGARFEFRSLRV
ncbi:PAS domain-containing sensor histidine kinase [Natrononativus amylolyticus]|uniref:PAS domain-containing sensor histidine kinase n=1 Tax=Natrononativus amylolyticus TaxID=2963434 RepID=UPI0020CE69E6|nr:PAS domain-containing sensor histidine kinase [Natrononativus amylolyticus]